MRAAKSKIFYIIIAILVIPAFCRAGSLAEDLYRDGISGASVRAVGMGGAFVHIASDNPAYYNPAAILGTKNYKLTNNSAFLFWGSYIFGNSSLVRINENLFFSLTVANDVDNPAVYKYTVLGGYALPFSDSAAFGFNVKSKISNGNAGIGFDAGLLSKSDVFTAGIMVQDILLDPAFIKIGVGISPFAAPFQDLSFGVQGDCKWSFGTGEFTFSKMRIGVEDFLFGKLLGVRFGYILAPPAMFSVSAGAGVYFRDISFDYAYAGSILDFSHWISAKFYFWPKTSEEIALGKQAGIKDAAGKNGGKILTGQHAAETSAIRAAEKTSETGKDMYIDLLNTKLEVERLKVQTLELEKSLKSAIDEIKALRSADRDLAEIRSMAPEGISLSIKENGIVMKLDCEAMFMPDTSTARSVFYPMVQKISDIVKQYPEYSLNVEGYSDSALSEEKNIQLSRAWARKAADSMIAAGIPSRRFGLITGYGNSRAKGKTIDITLYR